jgi:hypothetical protein
MRESIVNGNSNAAGGRAKVNKKVRFGYWLNYLIDYEHG